MRPVESSVMKQVKFSESGEVSEWLKEHAWKVCIRQRIEGSNPSLSARQSLNYLIVKAYLLLIFIIPPFIPPIIISASLIERELLLDSNG